MIKTILIYLILFYQKAISPMFPARCRHYPSCSEYSKSMIIRHGVIKGLAKAGARLLTCHPFHKPKGASRGTH